MRIRQIVFAAAELKAGAAQLGALLGMDAPYRDPGVAEFGLDNAVFVFGDQFVEIVSPTRSGTTAGRLIERRGDCGYMLILQTDDFDRELARFERLGVRRVWAKDLDDIRATHLHPKDIGGAIVSIDQPTPPASWRWGGPDWKLQTGRAAQQRVVGISIGADDPVAMAARWAQVLGLGAPAALGATQRLLLDGGWVDFEHAGARGEGIVGYTLAVADLPQVLQRARGVEAAGVRQQRHAVRHAHRTARAVAAAVQRPQTSRATSTTRCSLRHWSSCDSALPWCVLEKPHCGDRHRSSSGTNFAASSMRRFRSSFDSSSPSLVVTSPSTTFLPLGRARKGSKPPARTLSNSMK